MKPIVALVYDFDGTLSPLNMQEFGFIQSLGISVNDFWTKANRMAIDEDANSILCYMKYMLDSAKKAGFSLTKELLRKNGEEVKLYEGVKEWFALINQYGESKGVQIEHYINSSGLKEMIDGTPIVNEFKGIYACSYIYNEAGEAVWPAVAVDFSTKTQFLFKINKGIRSVSDNVEVNRYTNEEERPIPFKRMIYFGDGETDIPCMKLVKNQGGYSIAVYRPDSSKLRAAKKLISDGRVNFVCEADYQKDGEIFEIVKTIIDKMKSDYDFEVLQRKHQTKL